MIEAKPHHGSETKAAEPQDDATQRRAFLGRFGRFAAVTPPTIAVILAAELVPTRAIGSGLGGRRRREDDDEGDQPPPRRVGGRRGRSANDR
jgi:hypothetical protein